LGIVHADIMLDLLVYVLVGKTEGKRPFGRPRRRWEDNIKMDLQEVGCGTCSDRFCTEW